MPARAILLSAITLCCALPIGARGAAPPRPEFRYSTIVRAKGSATIRIRLPKPVKVDPSYVDSYLRVYSPTSRYAVAIVQEARRGAGSAIAGHVFDRDCWPSLSLCQPQYFHAMANYFAFRGGDYDVTVLAEPDHEVWAFILLTKLTGKAELRATKPAPSSFSIHERELHDRGGVHEGTFGGWAGAGTLLIGGTLYNQSYENQYEPGPGTVVGSACFQFGRGGVPTPSGHASVPTTCERRWTNDVAAAVSRTYGTPASSAEVPDPVRQIAGTAGPAAIGGAVTVVTRMPAPGEWWRFGYRQVAAAGSSTMRLGAYVIVAQLPN